MTKRITAQKSSHLFISISLVSKLVLKSERLHTLLLGQEETVSLLQRNTMTGVLVIG
jgi:hypothetical protein